MALTNEDLQAIAQIVNIQIHPINDRLDKMQGDMSKMQDNMSKMQGDIDKMQDNMSDMQGDIDKIPDNMSKIQGDINGIKNGQQAIRRDLKRVSDKVNDTYDLALENWGQIEESKYRLTSLET